MEDKSLIKKDSLEKIRKKMSGYRKIDETLKKDLNSIVEKNTETESKELDLAIKKYNEKLNKVLDSAEVKSKIEFKKKNDEKMNNLMVQVKEAFNKAIDKINSQPISSEEKTKRIKQLTEAIMNAVLSEKQINIFKTINNHIGNLPYQSVKILC